MAKRSKKRQQTAQLLLAATLASSTIAPYVANAEQQLTTEHEKTIDKDYAESSGGNGTLIDGDGSSHFTTTPFMDANSGDEQTDIIWRESIQYTMQADPNGPMAEFITNYLSPYFSNAEVVKVGNAHYIQLTLTGKAYGFQTLQYIDANGVQHDVQVVHATGEKLDQVRVIRLPLIQDEQGVTKLFVDSGELGYGAYTLFFSFDTAAAIAKHETAAEDVVTRRDITYTMQADPNGPMAEFITNYLSPYFSHAQLVTVNDEPFIELTLTGKAYGFQTLQYIDNTGNRHAMQLIRSTGEKLDQVRVVRMPLIQDENGVSKIFVDSGELGYGAYTLLFSFHTSDESIPPAPQPPSENEEDLTIQENAWHLVSHSNAIARSDVNAAIRKVDMITRASGSYIRLHVAQSATVLLKESDSYSIVDTLPDGTAVIEAPLNDLASAVIPFVYKFMNGMMTFENNVTFSFPFTAPLDGTVVEENRPFAITHVSQPYYTKIYAQATTNVRLIDKQDGTYAHITITPDEHIFPTIVGGKLVALSEHAQVYEVQLNEQHEAQLTFKGAASEHVVTYSVKDNIEKEALPAPYKGIGSYLDVTKKTDVNIVFKDAQPEEAVQMLQKAFSTQPYVAPGNPAGIELGFNLTLPPNVASIAFKEGRSYIQTWTDADSPALQTTYSSALSNNYAFEITYKAADGEEANVVTVEVDAFEPLVDDTIVFEEENVAFQFTAGADFETGGAADSYLKAFITKADIVFDEAGQAFAEITFGGHSYAATAIKIGDAGGPEAPIIEQAGSVETKDLVRTVRVPLDTLYRTNLFLETGSRGSYTFKFDFAQEKAAFAFSTGTAQDAYFSAWVTNADVVQTASGQTYAYITFGGHSYAIEAMKVGTADGPEAQIIKQSGSVETKDLMRTVRVALNSQNKAAVYLDGGARGGYTFTFDFTPQDIVNIEDVLTADAQAVKLRYSAVATAWHAAAFPSTVVAAAAKKVAAGFEVTLQITDDVTAFTVAQNGTQLAAATPASSLVTFTVASLNDLVLSATKGETTFEVNVDDITLHPEGALPIETKQPETKPVDPSPGTGGSLPGTGGDTSSNDFDDRGTITSSTYITSKFTAELVSPGVYGAADGSFITNYLSPYIGSAALVTVDGQQYIDLSLTGKAYAITSFSGGTFVYSKGTDLNQKRIIRLDVTKTGTYTINAGDYGIYNLTFDFGITDEQLEQANPAPSTGSTNTSTQAQVVALPATGDAAFDVVLMPGHETFKHYVSGIHTAYSNGKYAVTVSLNTTNGLNEFIVKQHGKVIKTWKKNGLTASLSALFNRLTGNAAAVSFEVDTLNSLSFEAITAAGKLEAAVTATANIETKPAEETTIHDGAIRYTMQADPNGPMAEFITNYLKPYFSQAQLKTIDGKPFIELTLTGKAYGFAKLQYMDAAGTKHDMDVVSTTGEKLEQVRVVRLPLIQDANGITKIFVDSGDLGYGAYTLLFKFSVPTPGNPFTDIDDVYSKDDILALYKAGITTGTTATTFSPSATINRAQFAVMLARALDLTPTKQTTFTDVKGRWYEQEVQALVEAGIVKGINATTFNPGAAVTRQQAALMIERMLQFKGYTFTANVSSLSFKDAATISSEARKAFAELQAKGILTGSNGYATPASPLKRAQMAKILKQSLDLIGALNE